MQIPRPRRAGRRIGARRRSGATADHGRHAGHQRVFDLLRADKMDMRINTAGRQDLAFTGDHFGAGADDDIDARLHIGIAGLADARRCGRS